MKCKLCEIEMKKVDGAYKCPKCGNAQKEPSRQYINPLFEPTGKHRRK